MDELALLYREVVTEKLYLSHGIQLCDGDVCLDVGANIGLFTMQAAELVGSTGTVVALEPLPAAHAACAANLESHEQWCAATGRAAATPVLLNMGAAATAGHVEFTSYTLANGWSTMVPDDDEVADNMERYLERLLLPQPPAQLAAQTQTQMRTDEGRRVAADRPAGSGLELLQEAVPPTPLLVAARAAARVPWVGVPLVSAAARAYVRQVMLRAASRVEGAVAPLSDVIDAQGLAGRVDLIKVDVERAELEVLHGVRDEHWPGVRQVVAEVHDCDGRLEEVQGVLRDAGLHVEVAQDPALQGTNLFMVYASRLEP